MWHTLFVLHHNLEARAYAKLIEFEKELREMCFVKGFTFRQSVLKSPSIILYSLTLVWICWTLPIIIVTCQRQDSSSSSRQDRGNFDYSQSAILCSADANFILRLGLNSLVSEFTFILGNNSNLFNICPYCNHMITMGIQRVLHLIKSFFGAVSIGCLNPLRQSLKYLYHIIASNTEPNFRNCFFQTLSNVAKFQSCQTFWVWYYQSK